MTKVKKIFIFTGTEEEAQAFKAVNEHFIYIWDCFSLPSLKEIAPEPKPKPYLSMDEMRLRDQIIFRDQIFQQLHSLQNNLHILQRDLTSVKARLDMLESTTNARFDMLEANQAKTSFFSWGR